MKIIYKFPKFMIGVLFWGIYRDGILIFSGLAIVLTFLSLWLLHKFFHQF